MRPWKLILRSLRFSKMIFDRSEIVFEHCDTECLAFFDQRSSNDGRCCSIAFFNTGAAHDDVYLAYPYDDGGSDKKLCPVYENASFYLCDYGDRNICHPLAVSGPIGNCIFIVSVNYMDLAYFLCRNGDPLWLVSF